MLTSNPSLCNKTCVFASKSHMLSFCEACAAMRCGCNLCKPRTQYTKNIFWPPEERSKTEEQFYNDDFRKVVIYNSISDALRDLHTSECKRPYGGCLWKPAVRHKVRTSQQLWFVTSTETFNGNQALNCCICVEICWLQQNRTLWCSV